MKTYFYLTLSVPCFDGVLFVICPFPCFWWRRAEVARTRFDPGRASHGVAPMFHDVSPFRDPDHSARAFQPIPYPAKQHLLIIASQDAEYLSSPVDLC
jgi:hypothetical protein